MLLKTGFFFFFKKETENKAGQLDQKPMLEQNAQKQHSPIKVYTGSGE